ncbi:MAG TPA: site-2 protease family protein [Rhodothermales bacterium]
MEPRLSLRTSESPGRVSGSEHRDRYWLHIGLFLLTLATTIYSGGEWAGRILRYQTLGAWWFVPDGIRFALSLLLFLTVHEFGHYIAARRHGISTSLPYYIPAPPLFTFGTLGAVIRIREPIPTVRKLFDVGASGPLAGFVVALGVLLIGFLTLPPPSYLFDLLGHEEIQRYIEQHMAYPREMPAIDPEFEGTVPVVGQTLLFWILSQFFADVPPMYELYHFPVLFAGWLGLFFTALNLLPVGQLDGGHILYALLGERWHGRIARAFVVFLLVSAGVGFVDDVEPLLRARQPGLEGLTWFLLAALLYLFLSRVFAGGLLTLGALLLGVVTAVVGVRAVGLADQIGYTGWFLFIVLIVVFIKVDHPRVLAMQPLTRGRRILGVLCILIFILCFSIQPIHIR